MARTCSKKAAWGRRFRDFFGRTSEGKRPRRGRHLSVEPLETQALMAIAWISPTTPVTTLERNESHFEYTVTITAELNDPDGVASMARPGGAARSRRSGSGGGWTTV